MGRPRRRGAGLALLLALAAGPAGVDAPAVRADARRVEVHVVVQTDLQRTHPDRPPDEPLEPAPGLRERARAIVAAHPALAGGDLRIVLGASPPNPRVPADFLALVDRGVDDVVVVDLRYHLRLDGFRATGAAGIRGFVAVHSVAGRRQVVSRGFTATAAYPGEVTKEAVLRTELAARGRGASVPVEEIEVGLLDQVVKQRFETELTGALGLYHPASLPRLGSEAVEEGMRRLAEFLADAPARRAEALQVLEAYVRRFPGAPAWPAMDARLRVLRQPAGADPAAVARRQQERTAQQVRDTLTAAELAALFERFVGAVVEIRAFHLDWRDDAVVLSAVGRPQDFVVEAVPQRVRELAADPDPIYVLVVGRRADPRIPGVDLKIPVLRWVGCPSAACPQRP